METNLDEAVLKDNRKMTAPCDCITKFLTEGCFSSRDHKIVRAATHLSVREFSFEVSAETFIFQKQNTDNFVTSHADNFISQKAEEAVRGAPTLDPILTEPVGEMEMIRTLGKSNHALLEFDLSSVLPMQTQVILMSKKMGKTLKKPVCCTGTYRQALNLKQHVQKMVKGGP